MEYGLILTLEVANRPNRFLESTPRFGSNRTNKNPLHKPGCSTCASLCTSDNRGKSVVPWAAFTGEWVITWDASTSRAAAAAVAGGN